MISPAVIKKYKLDSDGLKPLLKYEDLQKAKEERGEKDTPAKKRVRLMELLKGRVNDGRDKGLRNYRVWAAVDLAYDAPFYQETPTLLRHILSTCSNEKEIYNAAKSWGFNPSMVLSKVANKETGKDELKLNEPHFWGVIVPIMRSYMQTRLAKMFNDFNTNPLLQYEPSKKTELNRIRCEILTDVVNSLVVQCNTVETFRQMIFNKLMYATAFVFPLEPWYEETQENEAGEEYVVRRGIRHVVPHITRTFSDLQYPLATANTNTGCSYAGYWGITNYGSVTANSQYWNTEKIGFGKNWLDDKQPWANYFQTVYPCVQKFPVVDSSRSDREDTAAFYTSTEHDKAIFITHIFCKLVPKDWGLGDYKHEVWFKFTMAADDVIIWAEAYPYNPLVVDQYDADQNRARNTSLALETLPAQDLMTNMVNNLLLSIKRNLANIAFYDEDMISDPSVIENLRVRTNWQYTAINLVPFSSMKDRFASNGNRTEAFKQLTFPHANTGEQMQALGTVINLWDRMLGISAQEIGAAASHQQGNKEIDLIASSSGNRVEYTKSFTANAKSALMVQEYEAVLCFYPDEIVSQVSTNVPDLEARLKEIGFKADEPTENKKTVSVSGTKTKLALEGFASTTKPTETATDVQAAQAGLNALTAILNNPRTGQIIEPKSAVDMTEQLAKLAGAPNDFNLKVDPDAMEVQSVQRAMPQIVQAVEQELEGKIVKPMTQALEQQSQRDAEQDKQVNTLAKLQEKTMERIAAVEQLLQQAMAPQPPPLTVMPDNETLPLAPPGPPIQAPPGMVGAI